MALHPRELKLGEALVRLKVIDELQLASALASADQWGQRLTESLLRLRLAGELPLVDAIASITRTQKVDLAALAPDPAALALLDADFCRQRGLFPFGLVENGRVLQLAMVDPSDVPLSDSVAARARVRIQRFVAGENAIRKAIERHYLGRGEVALQPQPEEAPISELDELKLVDINGRTLPLTAAVISLKKEAAAARPPDPPGAPDAWRAAPAAADAQDALQRIEAELNALRQAQEMNERALKALIALLAQRGYVSLDELKARIGRSAGGGS